MSGAVERQAVDWMVLLCSGSASAQDRARFEAWQSADPAHARAWLALNENVQAPLSALRGTGVAQAAGPDTALRKMLAQGPARRRFLGKTLAWGALGAGVGWGGIRQWQSRAELDTGVGERQLFRLDDGSELLLNAYTTVRLDLDGEVRRVRLLRGGLIASVARAAGRGFDVETEHGIAWTPQARFLIQREDAATVVAVQERMVRIHARNGQWARLDAGQGATYDAASIRLLDPRRAASRASWAQGQLEVMDEPLGYVVGELRAYMPGLLQVSDAAAALRVQGVFPLDRPERALDALAATFPLRIGRYSRWLTRIDLA